MEITFYHNNDLPNKLEKNLTHKFNVDIVVKGIDIDISTPVIHLTGVDLSGIDYCYIHDFDTYYFIVSKNYIQNNLIKISLVKDVLMTYKNEILASSGFVIETDNPDSTLYGDIPVLEETEIEIFNFDSESVFSEDNKIYLTVAN